MRLFIYELDGLKITVEGFNRSQDPEEIRVEVQRHLDRLDLGLAFTLKAVEQQKRYSFSTNEDVQKIEAFAQAAPGLGILDGKWQHYSRDVKIAALVDVIKTWDGQ